MAASVSAEWQILDNVYYRKFELHTMQWQRMDLSRYRVACAPFGGPIAAIRDWRIMPLLSDSAHRKLRIFSAAGVELASVVWDRPGGSVVGMSWTDDQVLVCVVQDGTVYQYNIHAEVIGSSISMGRECFEQSVRDCVFWGNGMVCLTEGNQLFCISDFKNPRPTKLADPLLDSNPNCLSVIDPQFVSGGEVEVLLGVGDHILRVNEEEAERLELKEIGEVLKMAISLNGKLVASFTSDGRLLVTNRDFSKIILEYECQSVVPPDHLVWCGGDSILLFSDDMLSMVVPSGDSVQYIYDEPVIFIPECDGVRVLSNSIMEFLHRVPDSTVSIFKIGSTESPALLYDALDHFDRHSAKADENLRLIKPSLPKDVEACIDAAGHEFDVSRQRSLLRAASYGQAFCSEIKRDLLPEMSKTLRVLNAVRSNEIGIPLSIQQYKLLTAPVLVGRLVNAHQHLLALRISQYLGLNQEVVIMHWACTKISSSAITDGALLEILLDKLKICKGISYAAVAAHAEKCGHRKLAAMLVDHEPLSSKQIPLLLSIGEDDTALIKAAESGDTDLVYLVIFHIWQKTSSPELFARIQASPLARDLFIAFARLQKPELLKDFYLSTGQLQEVAHMLWRESWEVGNNPLASKGSPLHGPRVKLLQKARDLFSNTKDHAFEEKAVEEHIKLLKWQHELEVTTKQAIFSSSSVNDIIRTCIVMGNNRDALKVKTDFKVSEKRWYWLKASALACIRDWDALDRFSKEKRPPTGFKPFVEVCINQGEKAEALRYIPKLTDYREKAEAYAQLGMAKEAAEAASQVKDGELLSQLRLTISQNAAAASIFDTLRSSFHSVS